MYFLKSLDEESEENTGKGEKIKSSRKNNNDKLG
jgi:hypothetical protein